MSNKYSPILQRILTVASKYRNESHFADKVGFSHGYVSTMKRREEGGKRSNPSWEALSAIVDNTDVPTAIL